MATHGAIIPNTEAATEVNALVNYLLQNFPAFTTRFEDFYIAWKKACFGGGLELESGLPNSGQPEYAALLQLGPAVIPLVVQKLTLPDGFCAIQLYNDLETDPKLKVDPKNSSDSKNKEQQVSLIVELNDSRLKRFQNLAAAWEEHLDSPEVMCSANSWVYASGEAYDALCAMGPGIVANIMREYSVDDWSRSACWHMMLHEIMVPERPTQQTVFKDQQYEGWKAWFEDGCKMDSVPYYL